MTTPETPGRIVALMSITRVFAPPCTPAESEPRSRQNTLAPPCSRPMGWVDTGDGHGHNGAFCGEFWNLMPLGEDRLMNREMGCRCSEMPLSVSCALISSAVGWWALPGRRMLCVVFFVMTSSVLLGFVAFGWDSFRGCFRVRVGPLPPWQAGLAPM